MVRAALIIAAIVDVALAALMVGVSGFLFGAGPESMHGGVLLTAAYAAGGRAAGARHSGALLSRAAIQGLRGAVPVSAFVRRKTR
jgi:hypothetical protein